MGTIWVGIDDTDSPRGGCTTWVLTELLRVARDRGVDLLGEPRLVRLNPNIPWKTRGNAALAARFGRGRGPRRTVGSIGGRPVRSFVRGTDLPEAESLAFVDAAWERVRSLADRAPGTDPALVASPRRLPADLYWTAVREVASVASVERRLRALGATAHHRGSRRGLVGASAAIAWPGQRVTWELIAYRPSVRWGTPRTVDAGTVREAQRAFPDLFLCYDERTRRLLVAPHTPCPILFGLRSTRRETPARALRRIASEAVDRWVVFRTNQGTGDHLVPRTADGIAPYRSAIVDGSVASPPRAAVGGHVAFDLASAEGAAVVCLAFEPTKTLPLVARSLRVGDRVRVWGSRGREPALRLEGLELLRLVPRRGRTNPVCPSCRRPAGSLGRQRGYRCPTCRRRWPPEAGVGPVVAPRYPPGRYHPTPSARRHLAVLGPPAVAARESF